MGPTVPQNPIVLLTRPKQDSLRMAALLPGVDVVISPLIDIHALKPDLDFQNVDSFVFTSRNGVAAVRDVDGLRGKTAFVVGPNTAAAANDIGMNVVQGKGSADDLVALIKKHAPSGNILHLRGEHARGNIEERLISAGLDTKSAIVYRQIAKPLTPVAKALFTGTRPIILPVFSPRSGKILIAEMQQMNVVAPVTFIAMSGAVTDRLNAANLGRVTTIAQPVSDEMIKETLRQIAGSP